MQDSGFDRFDLINRRVIEPEGFTARFDIQAGTVASEKHPDRNEDAMFILAEKGAVGVFDGVGGHADGDKAAKIAKDQISGALQELHDGLNLQQAEEAVRQAIINANNVVSRRAQTKNNNMRTTASVVYIFEGDRGERNAIVGNVGDSRVYLLRNGRLEQITLDDNLIRSAFPSEQQARQLQSKLNNVTDPQRQLTDSEQALFNLRNQISQALGQSTVEPRIHTIDFLSSDRILVCSDGISDNLTDNEIQQILGRSPDSAEAVKNLIEASQARSKSSHSRAKPDDMTAIVIGEAQSISRVPKREVVQQAPQQAQKESRLQEGSPVRVQRSNGVIESGWTVDKFDPYTGVAIVIKEEEGKIIKKQIPIAELERLNRPATIQDIPYAENLQQLIDILNQIGGLQGSQRFYNSGELINLINDVIAGRVPLHRITRTGGLRQKVGDLIELIKIRKKL